MLKGKGKKKKAVTTKATHAKPWNVHLCGAEGCSVPSAAAFASCLKVVINAPWPCLPATRHHLWPRCVSNV